MSSDCTFSEHIRKTVSTANDLSSWCLRTFQDRSPEVMLTLWKSIVRHSLDYCSQLWNPQNCKGEIQDLEMTQRFFIKKIYGMSHLSYWEQLEKLKLYSLERRRERYIIIYIWYILEGLVPNLDDSIRKIIPKETTRHGRKCTVPIVKKSSYTSIIASTLPVYGARLFNAMPKELRNLTGCSKEKFKSELDKILLTIPDEPQIRGYTAYRRADSNSVLDMIVHSVGLNELDM